MGAAAAPPSGDPEAADGPEPVADGRDPKDGDGAHVFHPPRRAPWKALAVIGVVMLVAATLAGVMALGDAGGPFAQHSPVRSPIASAPEVAHEGWGVREPTRAAIEAMWEWANASRATLDTVTEVTSQVRPRVQDAMAAGDVDDIKFYCSQMVAPITVEMAAIVDTPDPDLTRALQTVVDGARAVEGRCAALQGPADQTSLDALHATFGRVASDLDAMVHIVDRDATIMERAGR
jgi:hypothetical protein